MEAQKQGKAKFLLWRLWSGPLHPQTPENNRNPFTVPESWECVALMEREARKAGRLHLLLFRLKNRLVLRMQVLTGTVFLLHFGLSMGVVLGFARAGFLSKKTGLPWEGYFFMLTVGNVWCILQTLCLERKKFPMPAFVAVPSCRNTFSQLTACVSIIVCVSPLYCQIKVFNFLTVVASLCYVIVALAL